MFRLLPFQFGSEFLLREFCSLIVIKAFYFDFQEEVFEEGSYKHSFHLWISRHHSMSKMTLFTRELEKCTHEESQHLTDSVLCVLRGFVHPCLRISLWFWVKLESKGNNKLANIHHSSRASNLSLFPLRSCRLKDIFSILT